MNKPSKRILAVKDVNGDFYTAKTSRINYIYNESKKEFDRQTTEQKRIQAIEDNNLWINKNAQDLEEFLDLKMTQRRCESSWEWLKSTHDILITENGDLDEIAMAGSFHEEIDIIRGYINEFKQYKSEDNNE